MFDAGLSDDELFPRLDDAGRRLLRRLREHPDAPRYNWRTGERLTDAGVAAVRAYAERVRAGHAAAERGAAPAAGLPAWVAPFVRTCRRDVPFYRARTPWPETFAAAPGGAPAPGADPAEADPTALLAAFRTLPVTRREFIRRAPWAFVPDGVPVGEVVTCTTSGTTGTCLTLPTTPLVPALYLPLFEAALATVGVRLEGGPDRVAIVHVCAQRGTVVLHSLSSWLGGAAFVKVNLDPADWTASDGLASAVRFLDDCAPELVTGDPFALWRLAALPVTFRPRALLSAGMTLTAGLHRHLSARFACPVLDVYSLKEAGPVAFRAAPDGPWEVLPPDLFVEVLDPAGRPCEPGGRGELALTGGLDPCLPLVRYATGDHAALVAAVGGPPRLAAFQGRPPVLLRRPNGTWLNSIDVTTALAPLPLPFVAVHQAAAGALHVRTACDAPTAAALTAALRALFGADQPLAVERDAAPLLAAKPIAFATDLSPPWPTTE